MPITFQSEQQIEATPEEILDALTDFDSWSDWMDGLLRVEKLTDGAYGVGTRWRETRKLMGQEATEEFEVVEFEPPHRVALRVDGSRGSSGKGEYRFVYTLSPEAVGNSRFVMDAEIEMPGVAARLFGWLFKSMFRKACDRDNAALKRYLETPMAS